MATATAPVKVPMSWRDIVEDRAANLHTRRDPRTGRIGPSALVDQIELGLTEYGLNLLGGPLMVDKFKDYQLMVQHIAYAAYAKLDDWAVTYAEATWPEGPSGTE